MRRLCSALLFVLLPLPCFAQDWSDIKDLPDFSKVGYKRGLEALPKAPVTLNVQDFGAQPNDQQDDTEAFQKALAALHKGGGVLFVPTGRWRISKVLKLSRSNMVLRGQGRGQTVIVCPKSLSEINEPHKRWSWSGGIFELAPQSKVKTLGVLRDTCHAGARTLTWPQSKQRPKVGAYYQLQWFNDTGKDTLLDWLYGGVVKGKRMGSELRESKKARVRAWVRVKSVKGQVVELEDPLPLPLRPEWQPTLVQRSYLEDVGLESLSIEFPKTKAQPHLKEKGYNAVAMTCAVNCWLHHIEIIHADSGVLMHQCRNVTIKTLKIRGKRLHHPVSLSWSSHCLVTDWRLEAEHIHGTTLSWSSHHNVIERGWARNLKMDAHRATSFANLHTDIDIVYSSPVKKRIRPFKSGGARGRGPHSAKMNIYWNIRHSFPKGSAQKITVTGHKEWPRGVFVGWFGNRKLRFEKVKGLKQTLLSLNERPAVRNLYREQRAQKDDAKRPKKRLY